MLRRQGNADARRDVDLVALNTKRFRHAIIDSLSKPARGFALITFNHLQNSKFIAAKPRNCIDLAQQWLDARGGFPQQCIASRMSERVIDLLKPVDIQQQDIKSLAETPLARRSIFDFLCQCEAVGKSGQRIIVRHEPHLSFCLSTLRDIIDHDDKIFWISLTIINYELNGVQRLPAMSLQFEIIFFAADASLQGLLIGFIDKFCIRRRVDIENRKAEQLIP